MDAESRGLKRKATDLNPQTVQEGSSQDVYSEVITSPVTVDAIAVSGSGSFEFSNVTPRSIPQISLEHPITVIAEDSFHDLQVYNVSFPVTKWMPNLEGMEGQVFLKNDPQKLRNDIEKVINCARIYNMYNAIRFRGICLIISNRTFMNDPDATRDGTEIDSKKLADMFEKFNFKIKIKEDLKDSDMHRALMKVATTDHKQYDCFVCCILSHGDEGIVYGVNGKPVQIGKLTSFLKPNMCPTLAGKPKLFFIQACQGGQQDSGFELQTDNAGAKRRKTLIPTEADFFMGYATTPNSVSYRFPTEGSIYIGKLVEVLNEFHKRMDLLSIHTRVNDEVSKVDIHEEDKTDPAKPKKIICKQMSKIESTLRRRIVFE